MDAEGFLVWILRISAPSYFSGWYFVLFLHFVDVIEDKMEAKWQYLEKDHEVHLQDVHFFFLFEPFYYDYWIE